MDTLIVGKRLKVNLIEMIAFALVIFLLMAGSYWRNQLWNNQIELWTDCVRKSPNKSRPYTNLSTAYFESGQYDKSLEEIQKAIKLNPKSGESNYNLGLIYQKIGDQNKAIAMEKKALEVDPTLDMPYYALGRIFFENSQYEEFEKAFQKFLQRQTTVVAGRAWPRFRLDAAHGQNQSAARGGHAGHRPQGAVRITLGSSSDDLHGNRRAMDSR